VLVAVVVVGALLLLFLRVRASISNKNASAPESAVIVQSSRQPVSETIQPVEKPPSYSSENKVSQESAQERQAESHPGPIKVFFDFNRATINRNVYSIFDRIDEAVRNLRRQSFRIVIEGNADSIGPSRYNVSLSKMRATRVADSLSKRLGISLENIELVANGSAKPAASNETREGRAENRRTEVHIYY